jgi:DNA-binding transcriptional ArsR family regulator
MVTYYPSMVNVDDMDPVFKALADPSRRLLLDRLFERDGQMLIELQSDLPMTRFGVAKHLRILEEAGLITTRKEGRAKFHYLNPLPIQQVYDRWVGKFSRPWSRLLIDIKDSLEE